MALSENNRRYFNGEAGKNRDMWKHADSGYTESDRKEASVALNMYATGKFDDVIKYQQPSYLWNSDASSKRILKLGNGPNNIPSKLSADGDEQEFEDEEYTDYENEASEIPEEEFVDEEMPKFRQLVRAKKLELKAQYGKAHFATRRECKNVPYPGTCYKRVCAFGKCADVPYPCTKYKEVCINVPYWVWGWRKKWREFKQAGGLSQLKMISRGMMPLTQPSQTTSNTTTPRGGSGRSTNDGTVIGETTVRPKPKLNVGDGEVSKAGVAGNIIGTVLILGLVFGAIKIMK